MVICNQGANNLEVLSSIPLYRLHLLFIAIFKCFSRLASFHAVHIHSKLHSHRIVLRTDKHQLALQELKAVLDEDTFVLLARVLPIAGLHRVVLIDIGYFVEV